MKYCPFCNYSIPFEIHYLAFRDPLCVVCKKARLLDFYSLGDTTHRMILEDDSLQLEYKFLVPPWPTS